MSDGGSGKTEQSGAQAGGEDYYWFKPKHHGYGAVPKTWQGWLAMGGFAVFVALVSVPFLAGLPDEHRTLGMLVWAGAFLFMVWRFLEFVKARTDGEWLWRHKGEPYKSMLLKTDDVDKT
ncbi:MAG: hypothetical protein AAFV45_04610 [Pseudomonadota bacterium]